MKHFSSLNYPIKFYNITVQGVSDLCPPIRITDEGLQNKNRSEKMPYMDNGNAERLVNTYADTILRISYMYLKETHNAEDICQEIFMKLLSKDIYFENLSHEKAWIIRTAINTCKDHLRTSFWKRTIELEKANEIPMPEKPDSELLELVMTLPKNYRISIYLHYYEGYQVNEIASMLGKSENTISAYLSRGRKKLKSFIENNNEKRVQMKGAIHNVR